MQEVSQIETVPQPPEEEFWKSRYFLFRLSTFQNTIVINKEAGHVRMPKSPLGDPGAHVFIATLVPLFYAHTESPETE